MQVINQDKYPLYLNAFQKTVQDYANNKAYEVTPIIKKIILYGVKVINGAPKVKTYDDALSGFQLAGILKDLIGQLKPVEFMNIFPIGKDFKGHKWEMKDYFYTKNYVSTLDQDEPLGDGALEFLTEYTNQEILNFNVTCMTHLSSLRRFEGYLDPMEEFMASQGAETANTFKNGKGESLYVRNGKPEKILKTSPKLLKLVK